MGNSIDKIADKFYISSVEPLGDKRRIEDLGVTHILNGAEEHLYQQHGGRLDGITYKVMGWDDAVGQIILPQLREAAEFIEQVPRRCSARAAATLDRQRSAAHAQSHSISPLTFSLGHCRRRRDRALRCRHLPQHLLLPLLPHGQKANVFEICVQARVGREGSCAAESRILETAAYARETNC